MSQLEQFCVQKGNGLSQLNVSLTVGGGGGGWGAVTIPYTLTTTPEEKRCLEADSN